MSAGTVPSEQTTALVTAFYLHWLDGMDKHAALKAAQEDLRTSGAVSPYYWGGFILVGS
jgi:CHAT domain-containing protein